MCTDCWASYGRPAEWNPKVDQALGLIQAIYSEEPMGGPMHATLDDWNVGDEDGPFEPWPSPDFSADVMQAAAELCALFNEMTVDERASALAYHDGYAPTPRADTESESVGA